MIAKTRDEDVAPLGRAGEAGAAAERQMAHYLEREFGRDPEVYVLNGLRLELGVNAAGDEDAAQIDHLIIHRHGMFIVESKSVSGRVRINPQSEWAREWGRGSEGMPSPIRQAKRQADALRALLSEHRGQLRDKRLLGMVQGGFTNCPIEVFVAISDRGVIQRAKGLELPELLKADAVAEELRKRIEEHRKAGSLANLLTPLDTGVDGMYVLKPAEAVRVVDFLKQRHTPRRRAAAAASRNQAPRPPAPKSGPAREADPEPLTCRHCRSINVRPVYRKDYCLLCDECGKYTPIDRACPRCGKQARVRKEGPTFYRDCPPPPGGCGSSVVFWIGDEATRASERHP